jgi:hypothetical protein
MHNSKIIKKVQHKFLSFHHHKIVALKPFRGEIIQIFFLKFLNLGQRVELDIASCVHKHEPEDIFS